jgi:predicted Fe-Mo cluster-binding NifX family protein
MKIALPTMDGTTISEHFGRCNAFLVFEVQDGTLKGHERRANAESAASHSCGDQGHVHSDLSSLLSDCEAVIVKGIGPGALRAMAKGDRKVYRANASATPEEAVFRMMQGGLELLSEGTCTGH